MPVSAGAGTLKDAMNEAIRDWITNVETTHYLIGSAAGPHPYPMLVRDLQAVIGREARAQMLEREGRLPDAVVACVGGGSNAIGLFHPFLRRRPVRLSAPRPAATRRGHAATLVEGGRVSVLHGSRSYVLADDDGQVLESHSISAGLDYPGVGPEHPYLKDSGRADVRARDRRRGAGGVPPAVPARGDHPGARVGARAARRRCAAREPGRGRARVPVRPRRQGHGHRRGGRGGA